MKKIRRFLLFILALSLLSAGVFAADTSASLGCVKAVVHVLTASCDEPTVAAVLSVQEVSRSFSRSCTIQWYRDGRPLCPPKPFSLYKGAFSVCKFTVCFSENMPETTQLTAVLRCGEDSRTFAATMQPKNRDAEFYARLKTLKKPYRIDVSRFQNVVLVWAQDEKGGYTLLQNAFLCSTGKATPRGRFYTGYRMRWQTLFGSEESGYRYVYGQYATRITNNILFHSVPYYTQDASDLESAQYNLLGQRASLGCVRLTVEACKWIYDNVPGGTEVMFTDTLELPVRMPVAPILDLSDTRSGWDPTDPDAGNLWLS